MAVPAGPDAVPFARLDSLSAAGGERSFLFRDPVDQIVAGRVEEVIPAFEALEAATAAGRHAAGYVAYEAAPAFDPHLATRAPAAGLPLVWFGVFAERVEVDRGGGHAVEPLPDGAEVELPPFASPTSEEAYREAVARILAWIAAGDVYQVNHTFRLRAPFRGSEEALYRRICLSQRAGYCAHLRLPRHSVLSASPELFFRWDGSSLELRPMKGTRPRGRWSDEDRALAAELLASPKERAENLMIVDLLRNDAGRISRYGSVQVPRLFQVESYPTVHQLTSTIQARTRPGTRLVDVFRALFPSGSVTGAPKIRASQIIAGLEDEPRGVYTGAIGLVSPGEAVFSVGIRTLVLDRAAGVLELGVGSGITADARPGAEFRECRLKADFVRRDAPDFRLLESLRLEAGRGYAWLEEHLARLERSAAYFGFRFDAAGVRARLDLAARELGRGEHKVRLLVGREGEVAVEAEPIREGSAPLRVALAARPVDERDPLLYHKTTRREGYRARAAERPDCDDVVLVNRSGAVTEATTANLVARLAGEWITPPLADGLLPGILRAHLLARGEIREGRITPADLAAAEAVGLINSVRGWRPAVLVP